MNSSSPWRRFAGRPALAAFGISMPACKRGIRDPAGVCGRHRFGGSTIAVAGCGLMTNVEQAAERTTASATA